MASGTLFRVGFSLIYRVRFRLIIRLIFGALSGLLHGDFQLSGDQTMGKINKRSD